MVDTKKCTSCKRSISNDSGTATFQCPSCQKEEINRCSQCKKTAVAYKCQKCGFEGP